MPGIVLPRVAPKSSGPSQAALLSGAKGPTQAELLAGASGGKTQAELLGGSKKSGGGLLGTIEHVVTQTPKDLYHAATGAPLGVYHDLNAAGQDIVARVEYPLGLTDKATLLAKEKAANDLGNEIGKSTVSTFAHPLRNPGLTLLNAGALAEGGAGAGLRGAAAKTASTDGLAAAVKAAVKPIDHGTRTLKVGNLKVHPETSPSSLGAIIQKGTDAALQKSADKNPGGFGAARLQTRVGKTVTAEAKASERAAKGPAETLLRIGHKLEPGQQKALQVVAEQAPVADRIAATTARAEKATTAAERGRHEAEVSLLEDARPHLDETGTKPTLADPKLQSVYNLMAKVAGTREELLKSLGVLSDEAVMSRNAKAARSAVGQPLEDAGVAEPAIKGQLPLFEEPKANLFTPDSEAVRVPDVAVKPRKVSGGVGSVGSQGTIGHLRAPGSVTHEFTGALREQGLRREDTAQLVAESALEANRFHALTHVHELVRKATTAVPSRPDDVAVRLDELKPNERHPLAVKKFLAEPDEHFSKASPGESAKMVDNARSMVFFPGKDEGGGWKIDTGLNPAARAEFERLHAEGKIGWVPKRILGEIGNPKVPLRAVVPGKTVGAVDAINNASRFAILYLKPAYAVPNLLGNVSLNLLQQGFAAPRNLAQAAGILQKLGDEDYAHIDANMGEGVATAISAHGVGKLSKPVDYAAGKWSKAVDVVPRRASFIHEAREAGYRTPAQLHSLLTDAAHHDDLLNVSTKANREIIDYSDLSPVEREVVRRVIFFYPWLKGATKYAGRLVRDKPVKSAALAESSQQGEKWANGILGGLPSYLEGVIPVGGGKILNPNSSSVLQSPAQIGAAIAGLLTGNINDAANASSFYTPALALALAEIERKNPQTGVAYKPGTNAAGVAESALGGSLPQVSLIKALTAKSGASSRKIYPPSREGAIGQFLLGGAFPRKINLSAAHRSARIEQRSLQKRGR